MKSNVLFSTSIKNMNRLADSRFSDEYTKFES